MCKACLVRDTAHLQERMNMSPQHKQSEHISLPTSLPEALTDNNQFTLSEKRALLCAVALAYQSWTSAHTTAWGETVKDIIDRWYKECM